MIYRIISWLFITTAATRLFAADPLQGMGFAVGQISGVGLSYRIMLQKYGFQITFGAMSQKDSDDDPYSETGVYDAEIWKPTTEPHTQQTQIRQTDANLGLMFIKILHQARKSTFYAFTGFSIFAQKTSYVNQDYQYKILDETHYEYGPVGEPRPGDDLSNTFYGGLGVGIEVKFTANIRLALEWPLTFSSDGNFVMYFPQAGFHYFF